MPAISIISFFLNLSSSLSRDGARSYIITFGLIEWGMGVCPEQSFLEGGHARLTAGAARLLAVAHPEESGILDISRRLAVDVAAVTRLVKELEAEKLVAGLLLCFVGHAFHAR
jgi:hypothetical protein